MSKLPYPVTEAFEATNAGDLARFLAAFASDGVVDDSGREFRGHEKIAQWSRAESIGVKQTFLVTGTRENGDEVVVTAKVGGGGYNGPATFTFRLAPDGETIQRMAISG
ncbi:nuclear transport factor 2 family protein [Streptomyces sp. NPDC020951]|uniref:nuclear transport factor 2 family protein n=1 Tax=Streptomyces sp. NPDC020951 TaxID=3365104 RepID=UPI00379BDE72